MTELVKTLYTFIFALQLGFFTSKLDSHCSILNGAMLVAQVQRAIFFHLLRCQNERWIVLWSWLSLFPSC